MSYDLNIEEASTIQRRLRFTLDHATVSGELERAFSKLGKNARIPGFRQGKVPRRVLEARFGAAIKGEVIETLINNSWREAMESLEVAGRPAVEEQGELVKGEPFTFTIFVDVKPTVAVDGYTGVKVSYEKSEVAKDEIEAAVQRKLQSQVRIEEAADDRPVSETDFVLTELTMTNEAGDEVASEPGTMVNMQDERYYPGVEALLSGMKKDDEKEGSFTIGESAFGELAGQTVNAKLKVIGIQTQVVPDLSDEVAKELGHDSAKDLKKSVKDELDKQAEEVSLTRARARLLEVLVEKNEFDVPQMMIDEQFEALMEELRIRRIYSGQDPKKMVLSDAEDADLKNRALFAARASCILMGVAKAESIEVSKEDLDAKVQEIADMRGQAAEAIRGYLERDGAFGMLETRILEEKTLEWLMERAELDAHKEGTLEKEEKKAPAEKAPAKKAAAKKAPAKKAPAKKAQKTEAAPEASGAAWNASMKKAELLEVAKERGLGVTAKSTKPEIVEALKASD